ncbi:MAG: peptidoglycan DD-metalloendopeptidase family protein [Actinomycetota bacterium]
MLPFSRVRWFGPPLALLMIVGILVAPPVPAAAHHTGSQATTDDEAEPPVIRELTFPVVGAVTYTDTWGACRGIRCSRSHKGVDIFGPRLLPLVAANDGVIVSMRRVPTTSAGNTVILRDDDGWRYVYLHVNNDTPGTDDGANPQAWIHPNGLRVGDRVTAGQVIGYMGDSGNAERTPVHLHFEIHPPGQGAVNPTASVDRARAEGRIVPASSLTPTAAERAEHVPLIDAWYRALLRRPPTSAERYAWADRFAVSLADRNDLIADLTMAPARRDRAGTILRAYHVMLGRTPELGEFRAWRDRYNAGADTEAILEGLMTGTEFRERHGDLSDAEYLELVYVNARGRQPVDSVRTYWTDQLAGGRPRVEMAAYFTQSYGLKNDTWHRLETMQAFRAALDRMPTAEESDRWVRHLDDGGLIIDIVDGIRPD